jgi:N-methylhydantoinase A
MMSYAVAVDVGGTFTDVALVTRDGRLLTAKTPTTAAPVDGVLTGLIDACRRSDLSLDDASSFVYGSTAAVNALLTRSGARVGLLTTSGFAQVLHLARSQTPGPLVAWLNMIKPLPLADLADTREITERITASGAVERALDEEQTVRTIRELTTAGVSVFAVGFLHSYANPKHERRTGELVSDVAADAHVSLSSDVHPEYREYDRIATTVANAYVLPAVTGHLAELETRLGAASVACPINIVRSDGGHMSARAAATRPIDTVWSGPSGGVTGALTTAHAAGFSNILTLDMGGTSTDVSLCRDGEVSVTRETIVAGLPLRVAGVDISSIGAGGGSIAYIPSTMMSLRVGPRSAGASPGPACYGRGGTEATVTDANLVLGRLPTGLLGGDFHLDQDAATRAVAKLGDTLSLSVEATARGIIDIVNEKMSGALRLVSVGRGLDPKDFALVAFGGAGPLHANALAERLGCFPVIIPPFPGVQSALGFHAADRKMTFSRTRIVMIQQESWPLIETVIREVGTEAKAWLASESSVGLVEYSCDVRFLRQGYEVEVAFTEAEIDDQWPSRIAARFREAHATLYGFVPNGDSELVTVRAQGRSPSGFVPPAPSFESGSVPGALIETVDATFAEGSVETPVYDRPRLAPHDRVAGPALLVQPDATTLVLPGNIADVDDAGNVIINPGPGD